MKNDKIRLQDIIIKDKKIRVHVSKLKMKSIETTDRIYRFDIYKSNKFKTNFILYAKNIKHAHERFFEYIKGIEL